MSSQPILMTAAEAKKLMPITERVERLSMLNVDSFDKASDVIAKALKDIADGKFRNDDESRLDTARGIAWMLGFDVIFNHIDGLVEVCGYSND